MCENRDQSGFFKLTYVLVCVCVWGGTRSCTDAQYVSILTRLSEQTGLTSFLMLSGKNFSRGTVILSSTHSSTKVVFCLCSESPFSQLAASTWGNRTHSTDKPEKHPDKTDYKQRARVQKC